MELHQVKVELHVAGFEILPRGGRANNDWVHGRLRSPTLDRAQARLLFLFFLVLVPATISSLSSLVVKQAPRALLRIYNF
jgi:hypothetical protein